MPEEEKPEAEQEESYYDDVRADIETAVYAFASLEEVDAALFGKGLQSKVKKAKEDCIFIICKGIETLKEGYENE